MSRTTGRAAEVLREGSGVRVEGTAAAGLTISTYIKDAANPPLAGGLPGLIYHQRAQSNELLLRAVTGTNFLAIRGSDGLILGVIYLACRRNLAISTVAHGVCDTIDMALLFLGKYPGL